MNIFNMAEIFLKALVLAWFKVGGMVSTVTFIRTASFTNSLMHTLAFRRNDIQSFLTSSTVGSSRGL